MVLMEEAAEAVASDDWTGAAGRLGNGRALSKPLVRPRCVVVVEGRQNAIRVHAARA
jgi:hypothetical protein